MADVNPAPNPWIRSTWADAGRLIEFADADAEPGEAAGESVQIWFDRLIAERNYAGAATFVAHALPRYECVVWAARALLEMGASQRGEPVMTAILRWIDAPDDALRRAAGEAGEAQRKDSPAKLLALAVNYSGGSIAPEELPAVLPQPDLCAKFAGAAIISGAYGQPDPAKAFAVALDLGRMAAQGG